MRIKKQEQSAGESGSESPRVCPICGKASSFVTRPFCSKRCADIDLHRWLMGAYAIPSSENDAECPPEPNGE